MNKQHIITIGRSMWPVLSDKCKVILGSNGLKQLDIVIYEKRDILICHRLINIKNIAGKRLFYLKGDFSRGIDKVEEKDIVGKVVAVVKGRRLINTRFYTTKAYYLFSRLVFAVKMTAYYTISYVLRFEITRKILKRVFPLKVRLEKISSGDSIESLAFFSCRQEENASCRFVYLAKVNNKVCGKMSAGFLKNKPFILELYVSALCRARRIGAILLKKVLDELKKSYEKVYASSFAKSRIEKKSLVDFYQKQGFRLNEKGLLEYSFNNSFH